MELYRVTHIQIICGDCAGDELLPRKTYQTTDGSCDGCGGRSYILAANLEIEHAGSPACSISSH